MLASLNAFPSGAFFPGLFRTLAEDAVWRLFARRAHKKIERVLWGDVHKAVWETSDRVVVATLYAMGTEPLRWPAIGSGLDVRFVIVGADRLGVYLRRGAASGWGIEDAEEAFKWSCGDREARPPMRRFKW